MHLNIFQQPQRGVYLVKGKREEAIKIHKILYNLKKILQYKTESFGLKRRMYHEELLKYGFFVFSVLFFVVFSLSNTQSIQLNFSGLLLRPLPVSLLVLIPFLVGIIFGSVLDLAERFSLKREVKRLRKELRDFEEPSPPE